MHGFGGSLGFGMGFGWIFWLVVIGVAIWAVIRLTSQNTQTRSDYSDSGKNRETPLDILKKRYARGEITETEYEEMRKKL